MSPSKMSNGQLNAAADGVGARMLDHGCHCRDMAVVIELANRLGRADDAAQALQATATQALHRAKLAEQQRDDAQADLLAIAKVNARATLSKLDHPTDFAEAQAYLFAIGNMKEIARKAIKQMGGAA